MSLKDLAKKARQGIADRKAAAQFEKARCGRLG
jgi:hypothetical protein